MIIYSCRLKNGGNNLDHIIDNLSESPLFKSMENHEILDLLKSVPYGISSYEKDEIIALEGSDCSSLGIILQGEVEIHKPFPSGKIVTINNFKAGNIFGEALVFTDVHTYPATVVSSSQSKVMYIKRPNIVKMMTLNPKMIQNFAGILSNRILMLNDRITNLSYDSLRKKIVNILLLEYMRQKSSILTLPYSRKKMAELLNIPRPSLSRELVNMKEEGLIDFYKNKFKIINLQALEDSLL